MKHTLFLVAALLAGAALAFAGGGKDRAGSRSGGAAEVVVWTYDSFNSEWGPGPEAARRFTEETSRERGGEGVGVRWVVHGDAGSMLSALLLEGEGAGADVVLGLDQNLAPRALSSGLLEAYRPKGAEAILPDIAGAAADERLTPFDYSYFAIIYDSEVVKTPPTSLEDLARPEFNKRLILMDPRTSSPGLGFFVWTRAVYGDQWPAYWERLAPSILTVAEGWDTGYGLFTAAEAPLVLSYTTSPGYHLEYEDSERYRAALFAEGHVQQVELAGLLAASANKENAKRFLDFLLEPAFQELVPLTNWMYPVTGVPLPGSYHINPKPEVTLSASAATDAELSQWAELMRSVLRP